METTSLSEEERKVLTTLKRRMEHHVPAYNRCPTPQQDAAGYLAAIILRLDDGEEVNLDELDYATRVARRAEEERRKKIADLNAERRRLEAMGTSPWHLAHYGPVC